MTASRVPARRAGRDARCVTGDVLIRSREAPSAAAVRAVVEILLGELVAPVAEAQVLDHPRQLGRRGGEREQLRRRPRSARRSRGRGSPAGLGLDDDLAAGGRRAHAVLLAGPHVRGNATSGPGAPARRGPGRGRDADMPPAWIECRPSPWRGELARMPRSLAAACPDPGVAGRRAGRLRRQAPDREPRPRQGAVRQGLRLLPHACTTPAPTGSPGPTSTTPSARTAPTASRAPRSRGWSTTGSSTRTPRA